MQTGLLKAVLRPSNFVGLVVVAVVAASGLYADSQNRLVAEQRLRADVNREAGLVRTRLEANINGNMQLVRGLIATLSTEPDMNQARFASLAGRLFDEHSQLRNI